MDQYEIAVLFDPGLEIDLEKSTAWRERRLVFVSDSLQTVAEEFNRYNQLQIDIQVPAQDARQITGTFNADDPGSFIAFLEKNASFEVIREKQRIVVRPLPVHVFKVPPAD